MASLAPGGGKTGVPPFPGTVRFSNEALRRRRASLALVGEAAASLALCWRGWRARARREHDVGSRDRRRGRGRRRDRRRCPGRARSFSPGRGSGQQSAAAPGPCLDGHAERAATHGVVRGRRFRSRATNRRGHLLSGGHRGLRSGPEPPARRPAGPGVAPGAPRPHPSVCRLGSQAPRPASGRVRRAARHNGPATQLAPQRYLHRGDGRGAAACGGTPNPQP